MLADIGGTNLPWLHLHGPLDTVQDTMKNYLKPYFVLAEKNYKSLHLFWHGFMKAAELYSYTTISDMSNYILPDTIGVASRMVLSLLFHHENYKTILKCQK